MNKRNVERFLNKRDWAKEKILELTEKYIKKNLLLLRIAFNEIKKKEISKWYSKYPQKYYHRTYDLYKIPHFVVDKKNGEWEI